MKKKTIQEYQEIISSHYLRASSDREAEEKLADYSKQLRRDIKDVVEHLTAHPENSLTSVYMGVMFWGTIKTTDIKLVRRLALEDVDAVTSIQEIRSKGALLVSKPAIASATWLAENNISFFWLAVQLTLLHPPTRNWGMHTQIALETHE